MAINSEYDVGKAFEAIENEMIASMMRNFKRHKFEEIKESKQWSMWQTEMLHTLEKYKKQNSKKYREQFRDINSEIASLISVANSDGQMQQEKAILEAIRKGFRGHRVAKGAQAEFFKLNERKLEALIKATMDDMKKAETAVLRMANDQYRKIIYNAQVYANAGAGTYEQAVDMATHDFLSAGLNCIEYKNGARHTLADYADMAIRTASKRAYLQGEGVKRQEWGIHTVIVNKRGNPCPKCLPFVGKVLIDDVWSGGTGAEASESGYGLMSSAISAGLYHPKCEDSHTTYFPGISTPPDDKFSRNELKKIEKQNRKEAKKQYVKRQAKKFGRLEKYSLDVENKEQYKIKKNKWNNIVAKRADNAIIESDLGIFKQKLRNDKDIDKEYYSCLKEKFAHGRVEAKKLFAKYASGNTVENTAFEGTAHFNTKTKKISMHYGADLRNERGSGVTWFHEHGHLIDDALGFASDDKEFTYLLRIDSQQYRIMFGKTHELNAYNEIDSAISEELNDMHKHSAISDMLNGITNGNIKGCAGHSQKYWENPKNITSEAFAHMFESQFDEKRYNEMKKYFPQSLEYFEKKLRGRLK